MSASDEVVVSTPTRHGFRRSGLAGRLFERWVVVLALVLITVFFVLSRPVTFPTAGNLQSVLTTQSVLLIVALGLTVVLAAGDLDLSIGGMIGFTAVFVAQLTSTGTPWPAAVGFSLVIAIVVGLINGLLIVRVRVNPLIMTLAMGTLLDGAASALSNASTLGLPPSGLTVVLGSRIAGIGLPFWLSLVALLVLAYLLHQTPVGRSLYFTGEGIEAARLIGIRVSRVRYIGLLVSAVAAWLGGLVLVGQTGAAQAGIGDPYLLPAYASAFLGAAAIIPGRFNPIGTFVGALLLAIGTNGLQLFGLDTWVTQVFSGGILVVAVSAAALFGAARTTGT